MTNVAVYMYLAVSGSMSSVAQGIKRVSAVGWIEIRTSRDAVLSRIGRSAVTLRQWVMLEVIVPEYIIQHE